MTVLRENKATCPYHQDTCSIADIVFEVCHVVASAFPLAAVALANGLLACKGLPDEESLIDGIMKSPTTSTHSEIDLIANLRSEYILHLLLSATSNFSSITAKLTDAMDDDALRQKITALDLCFNHRLPMDERGRMFCCGWTMMLTGILEHGDFDVDDIKASLSMTKETTPAIAVAAACVQDTVFSVTDMFSFDEPWASDQIVVINKAMDIGLMTNARIVQYLAIRWLMFTWVV
jgi:hypothetical protein